MHTSKTATVIGASGFLGRHLIQELLARQYSVVAFDIVQPFISQNYVKCIKGSIENVDELIGAIQGSDIVFHCASPLPSLESRDLFYRINIQGTHNVIEACRRTCTPRLVLTSSASVVYTGQDISNGSEDLPYPERAIDYYTESKALQEQIVLAANSRELMTIAIRPHGIFGPGDKLMINSIVSAAREGKMKFTIGNGRNIVDFTYVKNVVHGLILAAESLQPYSRSCGKAYNITNDAPIPFWTFMSVILHSLGYDTPTTALPYFLVYYLSVILAFVLTILRRTIFPKLPNPTFTPLKVALAGTHHYYSCENAKRDFGYYPVYSMHEAIQQTVEAFKHLRNE